MERQNSCVSCDRSVLHCRKHILTGLFLERHRDHAELLLQEIIPREIFFDGSRSLCDACWVRLDRTLQNQPNQEPPQQVQDQPPQQVRNDDEEMQDTGTQGDPGFITLQGYSRASNTSTRCIFPNCRSTALHVIPSYVKFDRLNNDNFYVPPLARICHPHLVRRDWEAVYAQPVMQFNSAHVLDIINLYKWRLERNNKVDEKINVGKKQ